MSVLEIMSSNWLFSGHFGSLSRQNLDRLSDQLYDEYIMYSTAVFSIRNIIIIFITKNKNNGYVPNA